MSVVPRLKFGHALRAQGLYLPNSKICIFTETYHPVVGGGERQSRTLAEGFVARGFPVIVVTRRSDASLQKVERYGETTVYRLPCVGRDHLKKWGLLIYGIFALAKLRRHYDIILVSGFRVLGICGVLVSKLLGKTCILKADSLGEMSGEFFTAGLARWRLHPSSFVIRPILRLRNKLLRRADAFVAISSVVHSELAAQGVKPEVIHMIPNSVDTDQFQPVSFQEKQEIRKKLGLPVQETIVTFTGRLVTYKGLPLLLQVWKKIQEKHARATLLLVGSGGLDIHNCEEELKAYALAHGLQQSLRFTGSVHNVHEYLQASDLFIFPTEREAFGISVIEAMACGLPVISTSIGGLADILEHQRNGLIVRPGKFVDLFDALDMLLTDPNSVQFLGAAARQTAEERYSATLVTAKYLELFGCRHPRHEGLPG